MHNNFAQYTTYLVYGYGIFASGANYAENAAKWGFEQAFWVVLFVTLVVAAGAWMKHALSTAIVTVIIGGILAYLCKQPEVISTIGNAVGSRVFGDDYG